MRSTDISTPDLRDFIDDTELVGNGDVAAVTATETWTEEMDRVAVQYTATVTVNTGRTIDESCYPDIE
jgi:hypothetical protein